MATCSPTGIRDFPIDNRVPVTDSLNKSIQEDFLLDIQWGKRSTAPQFTNANGLLNEGRLGTDSQTTTLRLQGNSYNLLSVQLAQPQHASFLTAARSSATKAEFVLVFQTTAQIGEPYLFLCIPIVTLSTNSRPVYLEALRQDKLFGRPIGLDALLPSQPGFLSYSTCIQQRQRSVTSAVQVRVLVFVEGITYPEPLLQEIQARIPGQEDSALSFPTLILPDNLQGSSLTNRFVITSEIDYKALLRYGIYSTAKPSQTGRRVDSTSSYQCVPLKPDRDIRNGQITIDTTTGRPLSNVLADKAADDADIQGPAAKVTPAQIEKAVSISLGIFILFCFALFIAYLIILFTVKRPWADTAFSSIRSWFTTWGPLGIGALFMGIIGFLIGMFVR
jgi:hypothetical protein